MREKMRKIEQKFAKRRENKKKKFDTGIMQITKQNSILEKPIVVDIPFRRVNSFSMYGRELGHPLSVKAMNQDKIEDALTLDDSAHHHSLVKSKSVNLDRETATIWTEYMDDQ